MHHHDKSALCVFLIELDQWILEEEMDCGLYTYIFGVFISPLA